MKLDLSYCTYVNVLNTLSALIEPVVYLRMDTRR
jgi:hypothetical protein